MIKYREVGGGSHFVFGLHPWPLDSAVYEPLGDYVDADLLRYVFADFRGYGRSRELAGEYTLTEAASDVLALADELGAARFHLVGNSMGGMVAQYIAATASERVKSLVLLNPVPASGAPVEDKAVLELCLQAPSDPTKRGPIMSALTGDRLGATWQRRMVEKSADSGTPAAVASYFKMWSSTDVSARVKGCAVPTKILLGEHDPAFNRELMQNTVQKWFVNCDIELIANAGHFTTLEAPCHTAARIEDFIKRHL